MHSVLCLDTPLFATFRLLNAHRAHTKWRRSRSSNRGPDALRFDAKENMSTSRFSAAGTRRNGCWTSSVGLIAVNLQPNARGGTPRRSAISCVSIGRTLFKNPPKAEVRGSIPLGRAVRIKTRTSISLKYRYSFGTRNGIFAGWRGST